MKNYVYVQRFSDSAVSTKLIPNGHIEKMGTEKIYITHAYIT